MTDSEYRILEGRDSKGYKKLSKGLQKLVHVLLYDNFVHYFGMIYR